ncbi:MAG: FtsW/RodA/SpoVE family cell cycle protein [Elusimicrobia bacterium]|nr:FtsW/RodA/SpoVE family cell cycle protein [Elusimicrobiota bacterium]
MVLRAESGARSRFDWGYIAIVIGLILMGGLAVFSAANPLPHYGQIVQRHLLALGLGAALFVFAMSFNYQVYQDQSKVIYGLAMALLVCVLTVGTAHKGHKAWLDLGFVSFQPSELSRAATILVLAAFLSRRVRRAAELETVLACFAILAPVLVLILKEPDFATFLSFFPIVLGMLFCAGASTRHLSAITGYGLVALGLPLLITWCQIRYAAPEPDSWPDLLMRATHFGWPAVWAVLASALLSLAAWRLAAMMRLHIRAVTFIAVPIIFSAGLLSGIAVNAKLKGYQRNRFVAYVAPQEDIQGAAYHVHQSQIAIGSGGLLGKGLFSGTQSQLGFLPERHTDFIYAVVGEEMGVWGTMTILGLYLLLLWRMVVAGRSARDTFGYLVCCGFVSMFTFALALNMGMCLGIIPVAGIPLPLISYGGSSLAITLWSLGIVANIYARRYALL